LKNDNKGYPETDTNDTLKNDENKGYGEQDKKDTLEND